MSHDNSIPVKIQAALNNSESIQNGALAIAIVQFMQIWQEASLLFQPIKDEILPQKETITGQFMYFDNDLEGRQKSVELGLPYQSQILLLKDVLAGSYEISLASVSYAENSMYLQFSLTLKNQTYQLEIKNLQSQGQYAYTLDLQPGLDLIKRYWDVLKQKDNPDKIKDFHTALTAQIVSEKWTLVPVGVLPKQII